MQNENEKIGRVGSNSYSSYVYSVAYSRTRENVNNKQYDKYLELVCRR